jgi:hypothetical protein
MNPSISAAGAGFDDPTACFTHIVAQVPTWLPRIEKLADQITNRQAQLASADDTRRRKGSSIHTISSNGSAPNSTDQPSPKRQRVLSRLENESSQKPHQPTEKPAPPAATSAQQPGTAKADSGSSTEGWKASKTSKMKVVYYDSEIQQVMVDMVRDIGSARNLLRKCRMTARIKTMTAPPPLFGDAENPDEVSSEDLMARLRFQRNMRTRGPTPTNQKDIYESIDEQLEAAQATCETAAHKFLRDGASRTEMDTIKRKFKEAYAKAKAELDRKESENSGISPVSIAASTKDRQLPSESTSPTNETTPAQYRAHAPPPKTSSSTEPASTNTDASAATAVTETAATLDTAATAVSNSISFKSLESATSPSKVSTATPIAVALTNASDKTSPTRQVSVPVNGKADKSKELWETPPLTVQTFS